MPPIVLVEWEDAKTLEIPWMDPVDVQYEPYIVTQVGFLIQDLPNAIILSQAVAPDLLGAPDQIPRGMIRSITYLNSPSNQGVFVSGLTEELRRT